MSLNSVLTCSLLAILTFAPLAYGTTGPVALLVVVVGSWVLMTLVGLQAIATKRLLVRAPGLLPLLLLLGYGGLQLVPLPPDLLKVLSPTAAKVYAETVWILAPESWRPLTLFPQGTAEELLRLWAGIAVYLVTVQVLQRASRQRLALVWMAGFSGLYALVGLVQFLVPGGRIFWVLAPWPEVAPHAFGTYVNGNHYAGLLELLAPLAIACFLLYRPAVSYGGIRERVFDYFDDPRAHLHILWGCAAVLGYLSVFFSLSRGGILSALAGLLLLVILLRRSHLLRSQGSLSGGLALVALLAVTVLGWQPIVERFDLMADRNLEVSDGRLDIWAGVPALLADYPLTGTGAGSFTDSFQAYQREPTWPRIVDHAHNDYLELAAETGAIGVVLAGWFVLILIRFAWVSLKRRRSRQALLIGYAGLCALAALALHALTEFNLHIGANLLMAFFVAGLLVTAASSTSRNRRETELPPLNPVFAGIVVPLVLVSGLAAGIYQAGHVAGEAAFKHHLQAPLAELDAEGRRQLVAKATLAAERAPLVADWRQALANLALAEGDYPRARQELTATLLRRPLAAEALQQAAALAAYQGEAEKAGQLYRSGAELDRAHPVRHQIYAEWLISQGRLRSGLDRFRIVLSLAPSRGKEVLDRLLKIGVRPFEMARAIPELAQAQRVYADFLLEQGDPVAAELHYRKALELNAGEDRPSPWTVIRAADFFLKQERYEEALQTLQEGLALLPEFPHLLAKVGQVHDRQGQPEEALRAYRAALAGDPGLNWVRNRIERLEALGIGR